MTQETERRIAAAGLDVEQVRRNGHATRLAELWELWHGYRIGERPLTDNWWKVYDIALSCFLSLAWADGLMNAGLYVPFMTHEAQEEERREIAHRDFIARMW